MVNTVNATIVKDTFNKEYNEDDFKIFISELLPNANLSSEIEHRIQLPQTYNDFIRSAKRIAKYNYISQEYNEEKVLDVLVVKLKKTTSIDRARTAQRNFIARYLNGSRSYQKDAALVAFISEDENGNISPDWRFSLIQMNYVTEIIEDANGKKKRKTSVELTPAKRFSFLVGANEDTHALFLLTLGGLARSEVGPWAIQAPEMEDETTARVFFSPSCSACRQLVMGMSEADARKIIWCPVAEEEKDLAIILNLKKRIEMGTPLTRSFLPSLETEPMTFWDLFSLEVLTTQFRLWCNDARVISSSEGRLPLVEFMGIPSALVKAKSPASPAARPTAPSAPSEPMFGGQSVLPGQTAPQDHGLPFDMGNSGSCGGPNAVPCP